MSGVVAAAAFAVGEGGRLRGRVGGCGETEWKEEGEEGGGGGGEGASHGGVLDGDDWGRESNPSKEASGLGDRTQDMNGSD